MRPTTVAALLALACCKAKGRPDLGDTDVILLHRHRSGLCALVAFGYREPAIAAVPCPASDLIDVDELGGAPVVRPLPEWQADAAAFRCPPGAM